MAEKILYFEEVSANLILTFTVICFLGITLNLQQKNTNCNHSHKISRAVPWDIALQQTFLSPVHKDQFVEKLWKIESKGSTDVFSNISGEGGTQLLGKCDASRDKESWKIIMFVLNGV